MPRNYLIFGVITVSGLTAGVFGALAGGGPGAALGFLVGAMGCLALALQLKWVDASRHKTTNLHAAAALVGFLALVVMDAMTGLLPFMVVSGENSRTIGFLVSSRNVADLVQAVGELRQFSGTYGGTRDARSVVWAYALVDSIFLVPAYGLLLGRLITSRLRRVEGHPRARNSNAGVFLRFAGAGVVVTMTADWFENLTVAAMVETLWDSETAGAGARILIFVSSLAYMIKWAAVVGSLGLLLAARLVSRQNWFAVGAGTWREAISRCRPLVLIVVVLFVALFQPLQVQDVLLSLGEDPSQAFSALLAALLCSITLWAWARYLLADNPRLDRVNGSPRSFRGVPSLALLLAVAIVLSTFFGFRRIVFLPGATVAVVGLLGLLLERASRTGAEPTKLHRTRLAKAIRARPQRPAPAIAELGSRTSDLRIPDYLSAAPTVLIGGAMIRAGLPDAFFFKDADAATRTTWIGVVLVTLGVAIALVLRARRVHLALVHRVGPAEPSARGLALVNLAGFAGITALLIINPVISGRTIGALAYLLVFLSTLAAASGLLIRFADGFVPPALFREFRLARVPVLSVFGLWLVVGQIDLDRKIHDVREPIPLASAAIPEGCSAAPPAVATMDEAWSWWLSTNGLPNFAETQLTAENPPAQVLLDTADKRPYPLIIMAASGGGIRAAWWTAAVMGALEADPGKACLSEPVAAFDGRQIFAASGISGGSLGLAAHQAWIRDGGLTEIKGGDGTAVAVDTAWVDERLGQDHLSPALAWFTYVELAQSVLGFPSPMGQDRAAVMEKSWEAGQFNTDADGAGLQFGIRNTWQAVPQLPMLLLNGTSVDDGCRLVAGVLAVNADVGGCGSGGPTSATMPDAYGIDTFLCPDEDFRLSTAALLSARFPLIAPSGRLAPCETSAEPGQARSTIEVVDGGYRDANGAETAADVWRQLAPRVAEYNQQLAAEYCLVPIFVQISDDFRLSPASRVGGLWPPLAAPLEAILAARGTQSSTADQMLRVEFGEGRNITIAPEAEPGATPTLGWTLSRTTRQKMADAVAQVLVEDGGVAKLTRIFDPGQMAC